MKSCSSGVVLQLVKQRLPSGDIFPPIHKRKMAYEESIQQKKAKTPSQLKLARMFSAVGDSHHSR